MRANTKLTKNLSAAENWLFCTRASGHKRTDPCGCLSVHHTRLAAHSVHSRRRSVDRDRVVLRGTFTRAAGYPRGPSGIARAPDGEPTEQRMRAGRQALE